MPRREHFDVLVLGSGQGGQLIAWHLAQAGQRTALIERRWIGGSCPNIACMPSKTELWIEGGTSCPSWSAPWRHDGRRHNRHGDSAASQA